MANLSGWIKYGCTSLISIIILVSSVFVSSCFLPEFKSPLHGLRFKKAKGYPRKNISDEIDLNEEYRHDIRAMGRMRVHERKILSIFPEDASTEQVDLPFTLNTCAIHRKYFILGDKLVDKDYGECWVLRQWRGINVTWAECDRYCKDVPASPPFFMFLCLPGHVIDFSFWVFCPLYRKFIMRTIELPQCCSCTKYTCLIQPRIIKIRNYYH